MARHKSGVGRGVGRGASVASHELGADAAHSAFSCAAHANAMNDMRLAGGRGGPGGAAG